MQLRGILISIVVVLLLCFSCSPVIDEPMAEIYLSGYFEAVRAHQYDTAINMYSPYFFNSMPKDKWRPTLEGVPKKLGELKSYKVKDWIIEKKKSVGRVQPQDGTYVTVIYEVQYANYPALETFVVFTPKGYSSMSIFSHFIKSKGFTAQSVDKSRGI